MAKGETTRNAILDSAVRLTSVHGLQGITIGQLAEEMNLSKSGLFAHFKSKEALQMAVLEQAAALFTEVVVRPALQEPVASRDCARYSSAGSTGVAIRSCLAGVCS
jgi:AcrR family transcriptional regulator